jgi:hypothetical protein
MLNGWQRAATAAPLKKNVHGLPSDFPEIKREVIYIEGYVLGDHLIVDFLGITFDIVAALVRMGSGPLQTGSNPIFDLANEL